MDVVTETLNKASFVLKHIPVVGDVIKVASAIAQKVQEIQDARDACRELGRRAVGITLTICEQLRAHKNNEAITANLKDFLRTLQAIQEVMNRRLGKGLKHTFEFITNTGKIAKKTRKLEYKLDVAMGHLGIQLSLDHSNALEDMARNLSEQFASGMKALEDRLAARLGLALIPTHDGHLRLIGYGALKPLCHLDSIEVRTTTQREGETIDRLQAVLMTPSDPEKGQAVILHKYARSDGGFADALMITKAWHPYILPILGRSPPNQTGKAYIVVEDYLDASRFNPFKEYTRSLRGFDKLRAMLLALRNLCEVADYLEEENLRDCIVYDEPMSPWALHNKRDVEQNELVFDLHRRRIKWKLGCPVPGEDPEEYRDRAPLFSLPALRGPRKQLIEQSKAALELKDGAQMVEKWFSILQGPQSRPLGLHRLVITQEPSDMESLVPVGTWLVQTQISPLHWSPLKIDDYDMHPPQSLWSLPAYEEPDEAPLPAGPNDVRPRARIYVTSSACDDTVISRDETNVDDFFEEPTTWNVNYFPSLLFESTLSFSQHIHSKFKMVQVFPSLNDHILNKEIAIVTAATYTVETTIMCRSAYDEQKEPSRLWFFMLEHDNIYNYRSRRDVPWGFWSAEENPTSIPPGITPLSTSSLREHANRIRVRLARGCEIAPT